MSKLLYRIINPPVKWLLGSPLHGLMSGNTLLLEFTGRKSGRALATPISYRLADGVVHCFTSRTSGWWRNLTNERTVHLTLRGRRCSATPLVECDDHAMMAAQLDLFLRAVPRDAKFSGVSLNDQGQPDAQEIERVVPEMVYIRFSVHG